VGKVQRVKLSSESSGSGTPLILLHGMGSASTAWKLIRPALQEKFQVTTIDLPGHGKSDFDPSQAPSQAMDPYSLALLITHQMDELGIKKAHIAGNSLGGWIALEIAAAFPDRVFSITGLAPAGLWLVPTTHRTFLGASSRYMAQYTYQFADLMMKQEWARKLGFFEVSPRWRELPHDVMVDAVVAYGGSAGYFPAWDGMLKRRFDKSISESIPVTILFGDSDNTLPAQTSQERTLAPSHARWVTLSQSGHAPMWDSPGECVAEIIYTASLA
jgi:pimeloyl-ACP methyl ester carboxylesterase